jgi:pimeloyl-ACP methyl ester carboxylesterase
MQLSITLFAALFASTVQTADQPIHITEGLAVTDVARPGGTPVPVDAMQAMIARGTPIDPHDGDKMNLPGGRSATWHKTVAGKDGTFDLDGYLFATVDAHADETMLLEVTGDSMLYFDGEPHAGDIYGSGYLRIPVRLHAGPNQLLVRCAGRGSIRVQLTPPRALVTLDASDSTTPDILTTDEGKVFGALVVINAGDKTLTRAKLRTSAGDRAAEIAVPAIPPMSARKVRFDIPVPAAPQKGDLAVKVDLFGPGVADTASLKIRVQTPSDVYKRTFVSGIDGSVQYYAVNPAKKPSRHNMLVLSTHGAGVDATGQAQSYASHDDWTVVAPTNRRPFGYDWEDWGRLDALEVLDIAEKTIPHDPQRVVETGHSMGGHGAWHLGLTYPGRFAAFGPSAGWCSFFSYADVHRPSEGGEIADILARAMSPSDTMKLIRNSLMEDVYILHGGADDNVPVSEAHAMRDALAKFNPRVQYHEQPGAGHWWGTDQGPGWGTACVDWKPMFEMFEQSRLPLDSAVNEIEFTTANPVVSARCHWVTILQQTHPMQFSTVNLKREGDRIVGTTQNVASLQIDLGPLGGVSKLHGLVLDGQTLDLAGGFAGGEPTKVGTELEGGKWQVVWSWRSGDKSPQRGGPLKQAFTRDMVFVYGTIGTPEENAWAFAKARFDAEQWQYRGNGAVDVVPDTEPRAWAGRNVILYGNADTNRAWRIVLKGCPIEVTRSAVSVGDKRLEGSDLGCVFLYPKAGDANGLVAAMSGTGIAGMRSIERLPTLSPGVALPDWLVIGVDALEKGVGGVRGAGYFGNDWKVETGDAGWAKSQI